MVSRFTIPLPDCGPVAIVLVSLLLLLSLRDIKDGVARYIPGFPNHKRKDDPVGFWIVCILRLIAALIVLATVIYRTMFVKE